MKKKIRIKNCTMNFVCCALLCAPCEHNVVKIVIIYIKVGKVGRDMHMNTAEYRTWLISRRTTTQ